MGDYRHCNIIGKARGSVGRKLYHVTIYKFTWHTANALGNIPTLVHHIVCYMAEYLTIYN